MTHVIDDSRAKRNVFILVIAQAVLGAQMPMIFTIGGLAGQSLASNLCFATLPISLIVLGSMLSATPVSAIMQRYGRRVGFMLGAAAGALFCLFSRSSGAACQRRGAHGSRGRGVF